MKIRKHLFLSIFLSLVLLFLGIFFFVQGKEDYVGFFYSATLLGPIGIPFLSKERLAKDARNIMIHILLFLTVAILFWNYMDHPWFSPPMTDCDGPCYGWFSFENSLGAVPLFISSIIFGCISLGIKCISKKYTRMGKGLHLILIGFFLYHVFIDFLN